MLLETFIHVVNLFEVYELMEDTGSLGYFTSILRALFPDYHGHRNTPRDVWNHLVERPPFFFYLTGLTPDILQAICDQVEYDVRQPRNVRGKYLDGAPREPRECGLDPRNRVLMVFIWMRQYPTVHLLGELFGIDKTTVSDDVHHIIPILKRYLGDWIQWPSAARMAQLQGTLEDFPDVIGAVDATIHPVWKPLVNQGEYWRGDKRRHCFLSQVVTDLDGFIINLETGYHGTNDAAVFNLSHLGTGALPAPGWMRLLADGGYPNQAPLIVPWSQADAEGNPDRLFFNETHRFCRAQVEKAIGAWKIFKSVNHRWRHPKKFHPIVAYTTGCLSNLKKMMEKQARQDEEGREDEEMNDGQ